MKLFKAKALFGILAGLAWHSAAHAASAESGIGVGFVFGAPSGLSFKIPAGSNSMNLAVGYDLNHEVLAIRGEYAWYAYNVFPVNKGKLPVYFGPGVHADIRNDAAIGVHAILGIEYQFADAPLDVFLELGPGINLTPSTDPSLSGGLGMRFFF
jgi:hypothetical protein